MPHRAVFVVLYAACTAVWVIIFPHRNQKMTTSDRFRPGGRPGAVGAGFSHPDAGLVAAPLFCIVHHEPHVVCASSFSSSLLVPNFGRWPLGSLHRRVSYPCSCQPEAPVLEKELKRDGANKGAQKESRQGLGIPHCHGTSALLDLASKQVSTASAWFCTPDAKHGWFCSCI